jgi:retinol dehydrogenase-12
MSVNPPPIAMITGGNSGIGFATARKLAAKGFHVIMASRNQQTSAQAIARIKVEQPNARVESLPLDLASFAAVRQCAAAFKAKGYPLHVLINNAGGSIPGKQASFTVDGFEMTLGTNHLGHFLLTNLLLDDLKRSAPARVITVSSQRHIPGYAGGKGAQFDWDNLKGEKFYDTALFYCNSKLANMWFAYELQRRMAGSGVTSNAVCPGFVPEAIGDRRTSPFDRLLYRQILSRMPFARSLDQASASYLMAATDPRWEGVGG